MAGLSSVPDRRVDINPDIAAARAYARDVKIACDDLHDAPFDATARAALLALIVDNSSEADAAFARALAANGAGVVGH